MPHKEVSRVTHMSKSWHAYEGHKAHTCMSAKPRHRTTCFVAPVAVCCSCCSVLQCVAVCCSASATPHHKNDHKMYIFGYSERHMNIAWWRVSQISKEWHVWQVSPRVQSYIIYLYNYVIKTVSLSSFQVSKELHVQWASTAGVLLHHISVRFFNTNSLSLCISDIERMTCISRGSGIYTYRYPNIHTSSTSASPAHTHSLTLSLSHTHTH